MRKMKKMLSLFLVMVMLVTLLPTSAITGSATEVDLDSSITVQDTTELTETTEITSENLETSEEDTEEETTEVTEDTEETEASEEADEDEEEDEEDADSLDEDITTMAKKVAYKVNDTMTCNGHNQTVQKILDDTNMIYYTSGKEKGQEMGKAYALLQKSAIWKELIGGTYGSPYKCAQYVSTILNGVGWLDGTETVCNNLLSRMTNSKNKYTVASNGYGKGWKQVYPKTEGSTYFTKAVSSSSNWKKYCVEKSGDAALKKFNNLLDKGTIKPGDVVFFAKAGDSYNSFGHVAIVTKYVVNDTYTTGNTGVINHASSSRYPNGYGMLSWSLYGTASSNAISNLSLGDNVDFVSVDDIDDYIESMGGTGCGFRVYRYKTTVPKDYKGYVNIKKVPSQSVDETLYDYDMTGVVYSVYSSTDFKKKNLLGELVIDTINSDGSATCSEPLEIDLGTKTSMTVYIKETDNGDGSYQLDTEYYPVTVKNGTTSLAPVTVDVKEDRTFNPVQIVKQTDATCTNAVNGNSAYSLEGAEYAILKKIGNNIVRVPYATSEANWRNGITSTANLVTDANGQTPVVYVGIGTFYVQEVKASKGYVLDTCSTDTTKHIIEITGDTTGTTTVTCSEPVKVDPVEIMVEKKSSESSASTALAGAVFEVDYYKGTYTLDTLPTTPTNKYYIATYEKDGEVQKANIMKDESIAAAAALGYKSDSLYTDSDGKTGFPAGTLTVREVKAPTGYSLTGDMELNGAAYNGSKIIGYITVDSNGTPQSTFNSQNVDTVSIIKEDTPLRADVKFKKIKYSDKTSMAGIPFKIINKATGESHIVVTDENGEVDTSKIAHSSNTNQYDTTYNKETELSGNTDVGTWFYGTSDSSKQSADDIDDSKGALLVGTGTTDSSTYILEELPCPQNQGKLQLIVPIEFSVSEKESSTTIDLGTISNVGKIQLTSKALSDTTNTNIMYAGEDVEFTDTVFYSFLTAGQTYTLKGILMIKTTDENGLTSVEPAKDDEGNYIRANQTFTVDSDYEESPQEKTGSVDVKFDFKGTEINGNTYVVYEYLFKGEDSKLIDVVTKEENGETVFSEIDTAGIALDSSEGEEAKHADMDDADQTLKTPDLKTDAWATETEIGTVMATEDTELVDTVTYTALVKGEDYKLVATVMMKDEETGEITAVTDSEGNAVTAEKSFVPENSDGVVYVNLPKFDATALKGKKVVIYEKLYQGNTVIVTHESFDDERQTVYFPDLHTNALDSETLDHNSLADSEVTIVDTVTYTSLLVGKEYVISGTLMNQETGEPLKDANGNEITGSTTFTPEKTDGEIDVKFVFDGSLLAGTTTVVFEDLSYNNIKIATHSDLKDKEQTVWFPEIKTSLRDEETGIKNTFLDNEVTLIDTVTYKNLLAGYQYKISGYLMNKETNTPILVDGNKIEAYTIFTAKADAATVISTNLTQETTTASEEATTSSEETTDTNVVSGTVDVTYKFDGTKADIVKDDGTAAIIVAFETLTIVENYAEQGHYETVTKDAYDETTYETVITCDKCGEVLSNLSDEELSAHVTEHGTYTESLVEGDPIHHEAETTEEYVKDVDATTKDVVVAIHEDINDVDQTVTVPGGRTTAKGAESKENVVLPGEETKIIDTVYFSGLQVGKEYTITGTLYKKPSKVDENTVPEALTVDGNTVTSSYTFTATSENGSVDMTFTFDASALAGEDVVVFEDCYYNNIKVFTHSDLTDENQTIHFPKVGTTAKDSKGKKILSNMNTTLIDTIFYTNLKPGVTYVAYGKVMDTSTKKVATSGGKEITAKVEFTPKTANGTVDVTFNFSLKGLENKKLVVFEDVRVKKTDVSVGTHEDWNDKDQTVTVTDQPKTGDNMIVLILAMIALLSGAGVGMVFYKKKKIRMEE